MNLFPRRDAIESLNESPSVANVYLVAYSHRLSTGFMAVAVAVSHTTMEIIYGTVLVVGPKTLSDVKRTYKSLTMVLLLVILDRDLLLDSQWYGWTSIISHLTC
jgi:hypothetical protein